MRRLALSCCLLLTLLSSTRASDRVPGESWLRFADPAEAGFDPVALEAARASWEQLPSSAFMIVVDGAVVAAWGDVERRFMCHSVRKSFLSGLYGIAWDRGQIELNKTMAELGIDDEPSPLLPLEKQARILDLLKARSAVYHPAAYAGRTDSAPRGSIGPGQAFGYNNWDFNTLAAILTQKTGIDVFEGFDEHFASPLGMQDWRLSDGYYHYELDKSKYPAYPFRLSARDAARFGLLYARGGTWSDTRVLSHHWVDRSRAMYSIDSERRGYGFMWWVHRAPNFERHGMFSALGVGNQMIAALPGNDMVLVNRANTYAGERTPTAGLDALIEEVLAARTRPSVEAPRLVPLASMPSDPRLTTVPRDELEEFVGSWTIPPELFESPTRRQTTLALGEGHLVAKFPRAGTFALYLQPDGRLLREDARDEWLVVRDTEGRLLGLSNGDAYAMNVLAPALAGDSERARLIAQSVASHGPRMLELTDALDAWRAGEHERAESDLQALAQGPDFGLEGMLNFSGYDAQQGGRSAQALDLFELNTRLFPEAFNTWDSLGELQLALGDEQSALASYARSLELNPANANAARLIEQLSTER